MGIKLKDLDTVRILPPDPLMRELKFIDDLGFDISSLFIWHDGLGGTLKNRKFLAPAP